MSTIKETSIARIQTDPPIGTATAFFENAVVVDGVKYPAQNWQQVTWSLTGTETVTVDGITLTDAQVSRAVTAIAYRVKEAADLGAESPA